jgi:hypothetical protein
MQKVKLGGARLVATAMLVASLGAIAGVFACSFIISDKAPAFMCTPGSGSGVCPTGQVCAGNQAGTLFMCAPPCTRESCASRGQVCDPTTKICVTPEAGSDMMMGGDDAPSTGEMDATTDVADAGKLADAGDGDGDGGGASQCTGFGCSCTTSSDCAQQFACAGKVALTTDIWTALIDAGGARGDAGAGICVEPCCASSECDTDDGGSGVQICFATGAGGNYCLPPSLLGDRSAIGMGLGGSACMDDAGPQCRSGLCASGICADTCCSNRSTALECTGGSLCRFAQFPGTGFDKHETATCALPTAGRVNNGNNCGANAECRSNLCSGGDGGVMSGDMPTCREPCRNASDCASSSRTPPSCGYLDIPMSTDIVSACMPTNRGAGDAGGGSPCQVSTDCARGYCAPTGNGRSACVATCFIERPGGSGDCLPTERCRPQPLQVGTAIYSVLACGM